MDEYPERALEESSATYQELMVPDDLYEEKGLRGVFAYQQRQTGQIISKIADIVSSLAFGDRTANGMKKDVRYIVDMNDQVKAGLDSGQFRLDCSREGEIFAQLRDANGRFGKKLPIKEEIICAGINPLEVSTILQMKAIEAKLGEIIDTLADISQDVAEVIQGQQNDRIGLYNSGLNLYREAHSIKDNIFRTFIYSQAMKSLSDSCEQIRLSLHEDISYLIKGRFREKKGKSSEEIQKRMARINRSYDLLHRCYLLKASIYYERGELSAMLSVFNEYGKFLKTEIIPHIPKLRELDYSDVLLQGGKWEKRAQMLNTINVIRKQLISTNTYYLGIEGMTDGERQTGQRLPEPGVSM